MSFIPISSGSPICIGLPWTEGNLEEKYVYKYDSRNNLIEESEYKIEFKFGSNQERMTSKKVYEYEYYK